MDSDAYNAVGPPIVGIYFPLKATSESKAGKHYRAANGTAIRNRGQRIVTGTDDSDTSIGMPIQVADVNKVLGSVREMVDSGNRVVLDRDHAGRSCSYVEHKALSKRTTIHEK